MCLQEPQGSQDYTTEPQEQHWVVSQLSALQPELMQVHTLAWSSKVYYLILSLEMDTKQ